MATVDELKEVVKETLEVGGVLDKIKTQVRAEVFAALEGKFREGNPPALSNENLLINELIREYLTFNNYNFASSVLTTESGQPKTVMDREFLKHELNVREEGGAASVPLLYSLVSHFINREHEQREPLEVQPVKRTTDLYRSEEDNGDIGHFVIHGSG